MPRTPPPLGTVIAEREYKLVRAGQRGKRVVVRFGAPVPDPSAPGTDWMCPYALVVSGKAQVRAVFGVDSLQALELALRLVPTLLAVLARDEGGELHSFGVKDTSLPRTGRTADGRAGPDGPGPRGGRGA
jgi:hypothetical protein